MPNYWYGPAEIRNEIKNKRRRQPEFAPPRNPNAPVAVIASDRDPAILLENGGALLLENGGALLLED